MHRRPQFEPLARLAAAGCGLFGPLVLRWAGLSGRTRLFRSFVSRGRVCPDGCCCGGFAAGALLGLAVPPGFGLGAWPASRVDRFILPVVAAAALPPVRIWVGCAAWVEAGAWALISR